MIWKFSFSYVSSEPPKLFMNLNSDKKGCSFEGEKCSNYDEEEKYIPAECKRGTVDTTSLSLSLSLSLSRYMCGNVLI